MIKESVEDYLGGIYRLRASSEQPLPLSQLQAYFNFSRVSIHEMVQKLAQRDLVVYHPYRGVTLTTEGERIATAVLRRHRLWERFLTDTLNVPWDEAHAVAERLEHVAPETITERLAEFLGNPRYCPHGGLTHPGEQNAEGTLLAALDAGTHCQIVRIAPETPEVLRCLHNLGIRPQSCLRVVRCHEAQLVVKVHDAVVNIPIEIAQTVWANPI